MGLLQKCISSCKKDTRLISCALFFFTLLRWSHTSKIRGQCSEYDTVRELSHVRHNSSAQSISQQDRAVIVCVVVNNGVCRTDDIHHLRFVQQLCNICTAAHSFHSTKCQVLDFSGVIQGLCGSEEIGGLQNIPSTLLQGV